MRNLSGNVHRVCAWVAARAASGIVVGSPPFFVTLSVLVAFGVVLSALVYSFAAQF
jgi:hypothetical protein